MNSSLRSLDHKTVQLLDGVAAFWIVLWLVIASATSFEIWQLSRLSDTAEVSAGAVESAGRALEGLSDVPLVGDTPGEVGADMRAAAAEIEQSADQTRADVRRLSILLGLSVFVIPVTPVIGIYLPLRLRRRRETEMIRRSLDGGQRDNRLDAYLARRALDTLSLNELRQVTADPVRDLDEGRHTALAAAELDRLGLAPDARR